MLGSAKGLMLSPCSWQGEIGEPGQKGSKGDKGEQVSGGTLLELLLCSVVHGVTCWK